MGGCDHFLFLPDKRNAEQEKFLGHCWVDTLNISFNLLDNDHIYGAACFNFLIITNRDDSLFNPLHHHFTDNEKCGKQSHSGEHMEHSHKWVGTDEPAEEASGF